MLNNSSILLNCFSRGGSNILWNVFLSHPELCSPIQETIQIFRLDRKGITFPGIKAAWLSRQRRLFDQWKLEEHRPVSSAARQFIDETLYAWKLKTFTDAEMCYKNEERQYTRSEVEKARLVAKNNNGLAFLTGMWRQMYPEATFIAMVRDPLALYESHKRRGITASVEAFAAFYSKIAARMVADAKRLPRYHLIKFEDLLADPISMTQQLYAWADLDFATITKLRFKAKPHLHANGTHHTTYEAGRHYWFEPDQVFDILNPQINQHQIRRLDLQEQERLLDLTEDIRRQLGYTRS